MANVAVRRFDREPAHRFRRIHFIGIGGAGMSGIAEVMANLGYQVSGSDLSESNTVSRLRDLGVTVRTGHDAAHVEEVDAVVVSTAVPSDNPELKRARQRRIPVVPRAEMLAELMRFRRGIGVAGTHGKTTTTSLTAALLAEGDLDPTFVVGGLVNSAGTNAQLGSGEYLVAEADESDGSFLLLSPTIAVVTNIDADHLATYGGDFGRLRQAFADFLHRLPFYGLAVLCVDDANVAALIDDLTCTVVTYGFSERADFRATELTQDGAAMEFKVHVPGRDPMPMRVSLPGHHNVLNALAAIAVAWELGVDRKAIRKALAEFAGIGRRFNVHGQLAFGNGHALFVDDYGHHPTELAATIEAARGGWPQRRLVVVFQPHRYSRTRELFDDFANVLADVDVLVLSEVYAAGEQPIAGADGRALARAIRQRGKVEPIFISHPSDCIKLLPGLLADDDLVLLLGAGDIGTVAQTLYRDGLPPGRAADAH